MATLKKYYGAAINEAIGAKQADLAGVVSKFVPSARILWARLLEEKSTGAAYSAIPGATVTAMSAADVALLKTAQDKAASTWYMLSLLGGEAADAFAMRKTAKVMIFAGAP
jgi:hypothetical protein